MENTKTNERKKKRKLMGNWKKWKVQKRKERKKGRNYGFKEKL